MPKATTQTGSLTYSGDGRFINGIPARDLDAADIEALASRSVTSADALRSELIASGIYEAAPAEPATVTEVATNG